METFGDLVRVEFSPDGRTIATARLFSPGDGLQLNEVRLYDATSGAVLRCACAANEPLTTAAGMYKTLHVRRVGTDQNATSDKQYWFACGVGKVDLLPMRTQTLSCAAGAGLAPQVVVLEPRTDSL